MQAVLTSSRLAKPISCIVDASSATHTHTLQECLLNDSLQSFQMTGSDMLATLFGGTPTVEDMKKVQLGTEAVA